VRSRAATRAAQIPAVQVEQRRIETRAMSVLLSRAFIG
jgi:hypothetical protein